MNKYKLLSAGVFTLFATVAFAGFVRPVNVEVFVDEFNNGFGRGNQLTARAADNDVEYIGCGTRVNESFKFGFCQAGDAAGNEVLCFTQNESLIDAMEANTAYSFIIFGFRDDGFGGLECTNVGFSTNSFYLPDVRQEAKIK